MPKQWCVYICRCNDGTLYTGITNDIERRLTEHNNGNGGAKYTRPRRPVELVYAEIVDTRSMAAKRKYQIKRMPLIEANKSRKDVFGGDNPELTPSIVAQTIRNTTEKHEKEVQDIYNVLVDGNRVVQVSVSDYFLGGVETED